MFISVGSESWEFKGTLCKNYSHLVVQLYIAFKLIVLACPKTTVGSMCQEAVTWHLLGYLIESFEWWWGSWTTGQIRWTNQIRFIDQAFLQTTNLTPAVVDFPTWQITIQMINNSRSFNVRLHKMSDNIKVDIAFGSLGVTDNQNNNSHNACGWARILINAL